MAIKGVSSRYDMTQEILQTLLHYDPETGVFTWRSRPREMFLCDGDFKKWNTRYSGKVAGKSSSMKYRQIMIRPHLFYAHRLAWLYVYGDWPPHEIDHANGDGHDNRISNLREATRQNNTANTCVHKDTLSGYKGVSLTPNGKRYRARIYFDGKENGLGFFDTAEEASAAYQEASKRLHGEFAKW